MNKLAVCVLALAATIPAIGHAAPSDDTTSIRVSYSDLDLNRPKDAAVLLGRIQDAALESCGASAFSFRDYREAVRRSACYQSSTARAVAALDTPMVTSLYEQGARLTLASN